MNKGNILKDVSVWFSVSTAVVLIGGCVWLIRKMDKIFEDGYNAGWDGHKKMALEILDNGKRNIDAYMEGIEVGRNLKCTNDTNNEEES